MTANLFAEPLNPFMPARAEQNAAGRSEYMKSSGEGENRPSTFDESAGSDDLIHRCSNLGENTMAEEALDERVSYLEGWKEGIDSRLVRIEERIEAMDDRLSGRMDGLDAKIDRFRDELSGRINALDARMTRLFFGGFGFLVVLMTIFKFIG